MILGLIWAVAAAGVCVTLALSGLVSGVLPHLSPLAVAPLSAYRLHRSGRVAGLVAFWEFVLGAAAVALLLWAFRDFQFRAPGR